MRMTGRIRRRLRRTGPDDFPALGTRIDNGTPADQQGNAGVANQYQQYASHIEDLLREEQRAVRAPAAQ